ncbi:MAG TPA: GNAT family N-acetyltransferase [Jiangellaceae bacterium]
MSESTVEIHLATVADLPEVRAVRLRALKDAPYAFASTYEREAALGAADWVQRLTSGSATFLARVDGRTVGVCTGLPPRDEMVALVAMWVDPAARGSGVAALLVNAVSAWAAGQGAARVHLSVTDGNERARRFYEKLGFVLTGEQHPLPGNHTVQEFGMVRSISAE